MRDEPLRSFRTDMLRPVTLLSRQWDDLDFAQVCQAADDMGFDGIEISCGPHFDPLRAASDLAYCASLLETLDKHHLGTWTLSAHGPSHCLATTWDPRITALAPEDVRGSMDDVRGWAMDVMMAMPDAAANMGVQIVTGCLGSPIWPFWYTEPGADPDLPGEAFEMVRELWLPVLDAFDRRGVRFAADVRPGQIAFDYYTAGQLLDTFADTDTLGINYDASHLVWQGINPAAFLRDFASRIYHVHIADVAVTLDGRSSLLGSFLPPGATRRGWNFRAPGHGDVPFEDLIRELNAADYDGPLSVSWEDAGMDRTLGAAEACAFIRQLEFGPDRPAMQRG